MAKLITIKGVQLGGERPLVCVPLTGCNLGQINEELDLLFESNNKPDIFEWRADNYTDTNFVEIAELLNSKLYKYPLIFTLRSMNEGGCNSMTEKERFDIIKKVIISQKMDLVDIELSCSSDFINEIICIAKKYNVKVILSSHDFEKTPSESDILNCLISEEKNGADIAKIAVTPNSNQDVLSLLSASDKFSKISNIPFIAISMGNIGKISRIGGGFFGSCLTFGSLENASASGQIDFDKLIDILNLIYFK